MLGFQKKLTDWVNAGLIEEGQRSAILAHEQKHKQNKFGRGLVAASIFSILVGIVSIIASNWHEIPGMVKVEAHFGLNLIVGAILFWAALSDRDVIRESALLAFFGLTLTLIALMGQIFQLGGTLSGASVTWMLLTLPAIVFFGRSYITAIAWMIGFLATITIVMSEYLTGLPDFWQMVFVLAIGTYLPLSLMADGNLDLFRRLRPAYAAVFAWTGAALLTLNASMASFLWYNERASVLAEGTVEFGRFSLDKIWIIYAVFASVPAILFVHAAFHRFYKKNAAMETGAVFALGSVMILCAPFLLPSINSEIAAALSFVIYWIFLGWIGQSLAYGRLISLAIFLIAARIFVVYVEVFGDMLSTGIGLIAGGSVMLFLLWLARKMNRRLRRRAGA